MNSKVFFTLLFIIIFSGEASNWTEVFFLSVLFRRCWGSTKSTQLPKKVFSCHSSLWNLLIKYFNFSCPQQLKRWPCHWLTNWLSHFYFFDITEWPKRLVTFETFDQSDEETWPDHDLGKLVCFSQKLIENKEHKSLHKMHFKPQGSSAVEELHKLTD